MILRGRTLTPKHRQCPDNPFMVPAVFEDLKHRWNKENILQTARGSLSLPDSAASQDFPWADVTIMVAGEADMHCAYLAKLTGSAVLTNDSDLILHDIGPHGSVVLLHSLELENTYSAPSKDVPLQAVQLHPASLARRFGLADLLRLAYELKLHPNSGLMELIRLAKETLGPQGSADYLEFSEEYTKGPEHEQWGIANSHHLDPRVSELVWQYETQDINSWDEYPRFYLAILNEDHTRRCAWDSGLPYRVLGYSIFNASRPPSRRSRFIDEFVRRGGRIARDTLAIRDAGWIAEQMTSFYTRLSVVRDALGENATTTKLWRIFALCEVYGWGDSGSPLPRTKLFSRFLNFGYMGDRAGWADIHLTAQVQAVLYSLRIMRQLIGFTTTANDLMLRMQDALMSLPPLHELMRTRFEMVNEYLTDDAAGEFLKRYKQLTR
ncbi:XPG domain containing-domain-containing protein [Aspergillus fumigatus]